MTSFISLSKSLYLLIRFELIMQVLFLLRLVDERA